MRKQTILVTLALRDGQRRYSLLEQHSQGPYEALRHFFEDIEYTVETIDERVDERDAKARAHVVWTL